MMRNDTPANTHGNDTPANAPQTGPRVAEMRTGRRGTRRRAGQFRRRDVLAGAGAVVFAGLAGCSGDSGSTTLPPPVLGDPDGDVVIRVFSDFSCPHCQTFHLETLPVLEKRVLAEGGVRLESYDFPLPLTDWSWTVPQAARAVQDLGGTEAFWAYSSRVYEHLGRYSVALLEELAGEVGVDGGTVRAAATDGQYRSVVEADRAYGLELGVSGTPAVFVGDRQVQPTVPAIREAVANAHTA
jgi:protein-disulfide isomerase